MSIITQRDQELTESINRADAIATARHLGTKVIARHMEERRLLNTRAIDPKGMLEEYRRKMATYSTLPVDPAGDKVRLYEGEWSIWTGHAGHGKTTLLRQMTLHFLRSPGIVFIASLEQDADALLIELAATAAGVETPSDIQFACFLEMYGDRIKIWDQVDTPSHVEMLNIIADLTANHGCTHAIIDSLMCLDIEDDDYEAQRQFAGKLTSHCKGTKVHIHLVAHPRKPLTADQQTQTWDVAGSGTLTKRAYNVFCVKRGPESGIAGVGTMMFQILKQRTFSRIGEIGSYFYRDQRQYHLDAYAQEPTHYLRDDMYPAAGLTQEIPEAMLPKDSFRVERDAVTAPWEV